MHCFNHQKQEAVGTCCRCNKGVCEDCCRMREEQLTCSDLCTQKLDEINQIHERAKKIYNIGQKQPQTFLPLTAILLLALGATFVGYALYECIIQSYCLAIDIWIAILGVLFVLGGFMHWRKAKRIGINW